MLIFIIEFILPILLAIYFFIEVIMPSVSSSSLEYFWFTKSCKKKPKEIKDAEKELKKAVQNMTDLKNASEQEKLKAQERFKQAELAMKQAKENIRKM